MKGEMLKSLESGFDNIEKVLLVTNCLDTRFKYKFLSKKAKSLARKYVIEIVEVEQQRKSEHSSDSSDNASS